MTDNLVALPVTPSDGTIFSVDMREHVALTVDNQKLPIFSMTSLDPERDDVVTYENWHEFEALWLVVGPFPAPHPHAGQYVGFEVRRVTTQGNVHAHH